MIFLLPFFSFSAIFGIDFGCEYIKVGMVQPGRGVHVALNQQSKRLSPSYFSFWNISNPRSSKKLEHWTLKEIEDCNWAFSDAAKSHSLRFPDNMIKGISPILENINGLSRREIMALVLRHLITTVDEARWIPEVAQIVLSVEPFLPRADRIAIAEAVRLSNASLAAILDSPTAAAQVYALEKRSLYMEQAKHVLFIDYGATFTWAAVFKFEDIDDTPIVQELSIVTNTSLGGNLMDQELAKLLIQKFSESNKIEQPTNKRFVARFVEEARRAKEILTLNKDVDINLEDVYEDYGLHYHLTRDEFETLIEDCNQSLRNLFNEALEKAGINGTQLDSIELIGGVTRVPYVQKVLMEISGMEKLNRTMNSDEAVALGAGYRGASNSAAFIVKKVVLSPFVNTNISIIHNGKTIQLFNQSSLLNETVEYVFNASENSDITIVAETNLSTFTITLPENTTDDTPINITFHFDDLTIPNISTIYINDTLYNDSILNFSFPDWALSDEQFQNSTDFIYRMDEILAERARFAKIKNDYESYIYRIKNNLIYNSTFAKVVNETERENLTNVANEHEQWLFENHPEPLNESMIRDKYNELHDQVYHAENRAEEFIKRAPAFNKLNNSLNYVFRHLNQIWPETKPWLTEEQTRSVWEQYNRTREWFDEKYELQRNISNYEDPIVKVNEIDTQRMILEWNFNSTNRIKKPTPTPPPKTIPLNENDNISFITINGKNITLINGTMQGEVINGTYVPFNTTDLNGTIINGTIINGTIFDGTNSTEAVNATDNVNETDTANPEESNEESASEDAKDAEGTSEEDKTEEEKTDTEKTEKKAKTKDKKKKKSKKEDNSESSESSDDDHEYKNDL